MCADFGTARRKDEDLTSLDEQGLQRVGTVDGTALRSPRLGSGANDNRMSGRPSSASAVGAWIAPLTDRRRARTGTNAATVTPAGAGMTVAS